MKSLRHALLRNDLLCNSTEFKPLNFSRYLQVKDKLILGSGLYEHFLDRVLVMNLKQGLGIQSFAFLVSFFWFIKYDSLYTE